jgi:TRAP transporter TAXI family solute receptor
MGFLAKFGLIAASCVTIILSSYSAHAGENEIVIGSGGRTGVYYPVAISICRIFNSQYRSEGYGCSVVSTGGSVDNLKKLKAGEINFAIVQSDWQSHAYKGSSVFSVAGPHEQLRSVFALYSESFTVLARANLNISQFEDLLNHRVNIGKRIKLTLVIWNPNRDN